MLKTKKLHSQGGWEQRVLFCTYFTHISQPPCYHRKQFEK